MNSEITNGKEELKKYIRKINEFAIEILFILYLIKKYMKDFEMFIDVKNYSEVIFLNDFPKIINKLLNEFAISEEDRKLLLTIREYEELIDGEHIRTNVIIGKLLATVSENDIKDFLEDCILQKLSSLEKQEEQFEKLAKLLLKSKGDISSKILISTDSYQLIVYIIMKKIKADILLKENESNVNEIRTITMLQILVSILGLNNTINISSGDIVSTINKNNKRYSNIIIYYKNTYKIPTYLIQRKIVDINSIESLTKKTSISSEYFYINEAFNYLEPNGTIISVVSDLALFKIANDEIKEELISKKMIKLIDTISNLFNNKEINIMILQKKSETITFRYLDRIELLEKPEVCNNCKILKADEINNFDLRPKKIIFESKKNKSNTININDYIEDCYRGCQIYKFDFDENGQLELLAVSDVSDGIITSRLKRFNNNNNNTIERFKLLEKDVLITTHCRSIKIALVENIGERKIIPNANFIIIRTDYNKVDPYYLEGYLTSKAGTEALTNISTGKSNIIINERNLRDLLTIFFSNMKDIEEQKKIGKKLKAQKEEIERCKAKLKEAIEERESFIEKIYKED